MSCLTVGLYRSGMSRHVISFAEETLYLRLWNEYVQPSTSRDLVNDYDHPSEEAFSRMLFFLIYTF
jgi:hypothetical protein